MINKNAGFSLIECLIYCAIACFLSMMAFTFFNRTFTSAMTFSRNQQEIVSAWSAQHLLRKDLQAALGSSLVWNESAGLVCKISQECVGWQMRNGMLYRIKGDYNFSTREWVKRSSALIAQKVTQFDVVIPNNPQNIEAVSYTIGIGKTIWHQKVFLLQKVVS